MNHIQENHAATAHQAQEWLRKSGLPLGPAKAKKRAGGQTCESYPVEHTSVDTTSVEDAARFGPEKQSSERRKRGRDELR